MKSYMSDLDLAFKLADFSDKVTLKLWSPKEWNRKLKRMELP